MKRNSSKTNKVMKIEISHPYYAPYPTVNSRYNANTKLSIFNENGMKMKLVNEFVGNMARDTWYLLPQAYSLTLTKTNP